MTSTGRPHIIAVRAQTILLASVVSLWSIPAFAQTRPERMPDKDVKTLIEQVDVGRDKFEGNLDGQFKSSTVRGPSGETKVAGALQDYQDNTQKLKDRFTADYSASAEVATVLKQSTSIDAFMQGAPSAMKGRSEWDQQTTNLKRLAESYGTRFRFPTERRPAGRTTRRPRPPPRRSPHPRIVSRATSTETRPGEA